MDWQEKARALDSLSGISLRLDDAGQWFVNQSVEIKDDSILVGACGRGATPQAAIENHWSRIVEDLPAGQYLVLEVYVGKRRAVRWSGFMWTDVHEGAV